MGPLSVSKRLSKDSNWIRDEDRDEVLAASSSEWYPPPPRRRRLQGTARSRSDPDQEIGSLTVLVHPVFNPDREGHSGIENKIQILKFKKVTDIVFLLE